MYFKMDEISRVVAFLTNVGIQYNRLDCAYHDFDIETDSLSCFEVARIFVNTIMNLNVDSTPFSSLPELYSEDKVPDISTILTKNGVYLFYTSTSFEEHQFIVLKIDDYILYIGGYGGIDKYIFFSFSPASFAVVLDKVYARPEFEAYKKLMTNNSPLFESFFQMRENKIVNSELKEFSIYFVGDLSLVNLDAFSDHFEYLVSRLTNKHYYPSIYTDIVDVTTGLLTN